MRVVWRGSGVLQPAQEVQRQQMVQGADKIFVEKGGGDEGEGQLASSAWAMKSSLINYYFFKV